MTRILWCITGAGHLLEETLEEMEKLEPSVIFLSSAGEEVARMYGLLPRIEKLCKVVREKDTGASFYKCGNVASGEFDAVVVSPCTSNTAAKIAYGIADSLVSTVASQALKFNVKLIVVPTDAQKEADSKIPIYIDRKKCPQSGGCPPMEICPAHAFKSQGSIDMRKCIGCKKCMPVCKNEAISFGKSERVLCRKVDLENVKKLKKEAKVAISPKEIPELIGE